MAEPSSPHNVEGENPEQPLVAEEEEEGAAGGGLPALKWTRKSFDRLMLEVQMPSEYGARYPSEGDTGADAPAGYVTMWSDFFGDCNLRLPLTVFVVDILEWYKVHISQVSPFGMIRIRNFEFTFRALGIEPTVGDFRRFYQMTVFMGFFSFRQRDGTPKLMTPPKGMTMWKKKFFYIKSAALAVDMTFRNVTETIIAETIAMPSLKSVQWFPQLQTIESVKLTNTQLWLLRMMLRRGKNSKPVVREKSGEDAPAWRMFAPDFEGTVETVVCADGEQDHNTIIRSNFRVPTAAALAVELPVGKGDLGALGDPEAKGVPKRQTGLSTAAESRSGAAKKQAEEAAAGGTAAGPPVIGEKRRPEQKAAGGVETKRRRLVTKRSAPAQKKPAVVVERQDEDFSIFDAPESPPRAMGAGGTEVPSTPPVKVVPESTVQKEGTAENAAAQIFDTVDSSNNLISPNEGDDLSLRFTATGKQHSDAEPQKTGAEARQHDAGPQKSAVDKGTSSSAGGAGYDGPPIQGMILLTILRPAGRSWAVWGPPLKLSGLVPHRGICADVQAREVAVTDLTARVSAAEERADSAMEAKDALVSSLNQLEADREWMRSCGISRIVEAIMNAPETAAGLNLVRDRARDAGFKAGYNRCIGHLNVITKGSHTDERSGFRGVDTESHLKAAEASFYDKSLACIQELDSCLDAADYVDRLRMLYPDVEEDDAAGNARDDAGTSGTK
ncbi:uncharacterized protein LOC110899838 [Helianthus annuus]|uniref:uncharacterized protein LOC110899838 n=1 Tax=Helianthus annuus TaxID=4232 RepID=UPI001652BB89|nr:uncharacterized protein LOC110899838 [Helianthus annuus]